MYACPVPSPPRGLEDVMVCTHYCLGLHAPPNIAGECESASDCIVCVVPTRTIQCQPAGLPCAFLIAWAPSTYSTTPDPSQQGWPTNQGKHALPSFLPVTDGVLPFHLSGVQFKDTSRPSPSLLIPDTQPNTRRHMAHIRLAHRRT